MMNDADDDSRESDDMVWDWSEQGRNYRRNVLNRTSLWPSWQGILAAFEDMKKTAHGQSEPSGESSDMLKIKSDESHANGKSLTEFQVRPNLLPTTLSLATQFGIMGESQPPSRYVADSPPWFRRPQTAVTVYDPAQRQAIDQQRLQQAHQTPGWGHQFAAGAQRNAVNFISQFFETPKGIAGIRRRDPMASYERGEQPAAAYAINESSSQQQAPAQDMGRNAAVTVQEPASVLSSTEGGSSWDIVSPGASAAYGALVWLWNYGGNQTPSGGVDAASVRTNDLGGRGSEIETFVQYMDSIFLMLENPGLFKVNLQDVDKLIFMMETNPDLCTLIDRETLNIKIAKLPTFVSPEIVNALKRLISWQPASTKIFSRLVDMLGRKGTQEYDENIVFSLINAAISSSGASQKSNAFIQHERQHHLLHFINEFYGLQEEKVRNALDVLLYYWESATARSATASLDDVTLINTLKSVFFSNRLYRQQYKVEVLEAGKKAIERSPGLFRKFGLVDIGKLRDAADRESITIARPLRDFATQLELYLAPEFSVRMDFSSQYAPYVSDFLRSKYPQHEFSIGQESPIKITDETGLESSSPSLLEALLSHHKVTMEFPSGTPEAIKDYITRYQSRALTHDEADEFLKFSKISDRKEIARRLQLAGSGTEGSLVTDVKKTLPQYQYILDAVSARDTLRHERANAVGSLRLAAPEHCLYINVRILQLRRMEALIEQDISAEIIQLENASVHESTLPKYLDYGLRDLFKHLESDAINPEHVSSIPALEDALVGNESLKGELAFYLVDYLAKHGLPEMPKALSLLKSVWEALKNSLSRQPPTTLQPSTAAPSTAAPSLDDVLATWFNPYIHTPAEFIDQWITLQMQQAGLTRDYRKDWVSIYYRTLVKPNKDNFFGKETKENHTTLKLREFVSRQYLKKKSKEGWKDVKIKWPSAFPTALRAKLEGGAWEDFNKFIVKFIKHDSFEKGTDIIRLIAQGIAGKKLDEKTGDEYKNRPRKIIFTARGVKTPLAGAFELDGRIYSLSNETSYPAPQEGKRDQLFEQTIPKSLSTLVKQGLSKNERDKLDDNLLDQRWRGMVRYEPKLRVQWPYFTYEKIEPGQFAREMMRRTLQKFDDDMDRTTYSHWEQNWDTAADIMEKALLVASLPIAAVTGPWVGVGMALLSTVPELIRMGTADTQEESKQALNALLLGLLLDLGGEALTPVVMKGLNKIAERKSRKLLQDISSKPHAPVIKLEDLEDWAIEVRGKVKGKAVISDAEVDKLGNIPQAAKAQRNLDLRVGGNTDLEIRNKYDNYVKMLKNSSDQSFNAGVEQFKRDGTLAHLVGKLPHNYQMMKDTQLMNEVFTGNPLKLTTHELGEVSEFIRLARKQAEMQEVALKAMELAYRLSPGTTRLSLHPQTLLTEAAGKGSRGRCRPLAYAMEVAIHNGRGEQMLANLGRVRSQVDLGAGRRYIKALDDFHDQTLEAIETAVTVGNREWLSVSEIVAQLQKEPGAASFSLRTDIHAMSVGVSVKDNGAKRYHFYDPNIGLAEYSSPEALGKGLDKTIGNKRLAEHYGADDGHYKLYRLDVDALAKTPIARSPEWKIADFSEPKQPDPTKWVRTDGRLHKALVESVCHTGRGKRSLCPMAKNFQPTPELSMASMARPSYKMVDWEEGVGQFIDDLETQRVKVLFSLDDHLRGELLPSGMPKDRYLKEQLNQRGIDYVIEPRNAIKDGYDFAVDADFTQPGPARLQVEQIQSLVDQINLRRAAVEADDVVAVHCGYGDGRSGTVKSAVMIHKMWHENPGRYLQDLADNKKPALIRTELSDSLGEELKFDNPAHQLVADAINSVRKTHENAVERIPDVNLLNAYARSLLNRP